MIQFEVINGISQKKNCEKLIFDIEFCSKVCELQEQDVCHKYPEIGDDLCSEETECKEDNLGINRCSKIYSDDYSNIESFFGNI